MYDKARIPAVEMLVHAHGGLQLLQQCAVRTLALGMHGGANVVQHAHDASGVLQGGEKQAKPPPSGGRLDSDTLTTLFSMRSHTILLLK